MKCITLVLVTPCAERKSYTLFTCSNVFITYLMDLYTLYTGHEKWCAPIFSADTIQSIVTLQVEDIIDPCHWLNCIQWTRYRRQGSEFCLEWFVSRPKHSAFYYSLGVQGNLLVNKNNPNETIQIHEKTVHMMTDEIVSCCRKPIIIQIDKKDV